MNKIEHYYEEIKKMCGLLVKYDKSYFNAPAITAEIDSFQASNSLTLPDELVELYKCANGFQVLGRTATVYKLSEVGIKVKGIPKDYVVFGEIVGDGELLCFHVATREIVTVYNNKVSAYSVIGLLEYCIDQCKDGFFMAKPDISPFLALDTDILDSIRKIYGLKSVMIRDLAKAFAEAEEEPREKFMFDLPIIIRAAVFSFIEPRLCSEFVDHLRRKDPVKADNFIRGMKRRAIDNYFNRERKNLDEGGASFHWNVQQMREIYNFDDKGMSYMNAGIVYAYDRAGNIVDDVLSTRSGGKVLYKNKIGIDYKFDVYNNNQYLGNVNNIKLKGV
ncbi:SMI1/KNR4 family protein [Ruminococcus flavefaciens]|uniref:SMI1/KNR4 family protein n=1 Tax=Ruminococcus flavefaciens TaxID=1265 RepID=UPI0026F20854|nr:SMI1/KNR4 family protein [Ruminococcus flavefaciens]